MDKLLNLDGKKGLIVGIANEHSDELLEKAAAQAPRQQLVSIDDVGAVAACLVSDAAAALTGHTAYVDAGLHIRA